MKRSVLISFTVSLLTVPLLARPAVAQVTEPPPTDPSVRVHDGFYFRIAAGLGAYSEGLRSKNSEEYGGTVRGRSAGFATMGEFALGGTISRGLVLGGGAYTAQLVSGTYRTYRDSDGVPPPELDPEVRNFALVGPFFDWYPTPEKGFHIQAALGVASLSGVQLDAFPLRDDEPYTAFGGGVMFGVGYEWWIAEQWSMGVLGRVMGAVLRGKDDQDVRWTHTAGTSPSVLLSVTYH